MKTSSKRSGLISVCVIATLTIFSNTIKNAGANTGILFRENKGQVGDQNHKPRPDVLFSGADGDLVYHLKQNGISYQLNKIESKEVRDNSEKKSPFDFLTSRTAKKAEKRTIYRVDVNWVSSNPVSEIKKDKLLDGYENFYHETCPQGALKVKSYKRVTYENIYEGIDLQWYEDKGHLKCDYLVSPGGDYRNIKLQFAGALSLKLGRARELIIKTPLGDITEDAPLVMQGNRCLPAKWQINGTEVSFHIEGVDVSMPLVIDPLVRLWATYYGGSGDDDVSGTCVDLQNNLIISGNTQSGAGTNIATTGAYQSVYGGAGTSFQPGDAFLALFNSSGVRQWATYYGGSGSEFGFDCAADNNGNIFVVGQTTTTNSMVIATAGSYQNFFAGGSAIGDAFVAKFDPSGARLWGTYYGDANDDWAVTTCVDLNGNVYLGGGVWDAPLNTMGTPGSCQPAHASGSSYDAFIVKFSPTGSRLWGTYFGAERNEQAYCCAADGLGNVYFGGATGSTNTAVMTTGGCHQPVFGGGTLDDGFLVKFDPNGSRLWSTYVGGNGLDFISDCAIDSNNDLFISGGTTTSGGVAISTPGSYQPVYAGGSGDVYFAKFSSSGQRYFGSYYGGALYDDWGFCAIAPSGDFYLAGNALTSTGTAIASAGGYQSIYGGGNNDCFLARFTPAGNRLWGTYYGASGDEYIQRVVVDGSNNVYLTGITNVNAPSAMTSAAAHQTAYAGGPNDCFIAKFDRCFAVNPPDITQNHTVCSQPSPTLATSVTSGVNWYSSPSGNNLVGSGSTFIPLNLIPGDTTFYIGEDGCGYSTGSLTPVQLHVMPSPVIIGLATPSIICSGETAGLTAFGATSYTWNTGTSVHVTSVSVKPTVTTSYTVTGTNSYGCLHNALVNLIVSPCLELSEVSKNNNDFIVYPNPSPGRFYTQTKNPASLLLVNELGQVIEVIDLNEGNNFSQSTEKLSAGVYLLLDTLQGRKQKVIVMK